MFPLALALTLAAVEAPLVEQQPRDASRLHASVHLAGAFALGAGAFGVGPGVAGTLGVMLGDRFALFARASFGTIVTYHAGSLGLGADLALGEHWSLGLGLAGAFHGSTSLDVPSAWSVIAPVRLGVSATTRAPHELARRGLHLFVELAPGVAPRATTVSGVGIVPDPSPQPAAAFVFFASVGVGYAWR